MPTAKTVLAGLIASALVAGFVTPAHSTTDCLRIGETFFKNGEVVEKTACEGQRVPPMKEITPRAPVHHDKCAGKPAGHEFVAVGPDGKRLARYVCRGGAPLLS